MPDLQKISTVNPTISSLGEPAPPDTSLAESIQQVGGAIRSFAVEKKKDRLEEELESLGDEVFAASVGKQVRETTDRFKRLQRAQEDGALDNTMVRIEAEAILKETIGSIPGFADEVRMEAARILGYDPTGARLRDLLNVPTPSTAQTFAEKQREQAEFIAQTTDVNVNDVLALQGQAMLTKQQSDIVANQAAIGGATRRDVLNAVVNQGQGRMADVMGELLMTINSGGIKNPQEIKSLVTAMASQHKAELRAQYEVAGLSPDSQQLSSDLSAIDSLWDPLNQLAEDGALAEILAQNDKALTHALAIAGKEVFGDVALINSVAGQEGVRNYFLYTEKYTKPEELELLKKINPELALVADNIGTARRLASDAFKNVFGYTPSFPTGRAQGATGEAPEYSPEALNAMSDKVLYDSLKDGKLTEEEKSARLAYAKNRGQKFKVLGGYFQEGARKNALDEEVRFVKQTFEEEYEPLMNRVAARFVADEKLNQINIEIRNGELAFSRVIQPVGPREGFRRPQDFITPQMEGDLKRLNTFIRGVKNGWAGDLGQNPNSFVNETLNQINQQRQAGVEQDTDVATALEAFNRNPSPENLEALRAIAPDIVADAERIAAGGGDAQ